MESPLNKKIQRSLEREAAKKKKDSNYIPVLTLRQQVLSLVTEANKSAESERQVTPRAALIVMDRALANLSAVEDEARDFAVLREVSSFISTAQKTTVTTASIHTDLLPQGHPLSALNASLTPEEYRVKYATWIAADTHISPNARPLVAAAFSAEPGSIEREHAFMRLNVTKEQVPAYLKLDPAPLVAAFSDGNSSAARRARVALQWRDKKGRWVEMGRGANFRYRMPGGGVASASGVYVGVATPRPGENRNPSGLIQVSGDANLPDGIYAVQPSNVETYSARVPLEALKKAGITPGATPSQSMVGVPSQVDLLSTRRDAPEGWTKQDDITFTSDDNYTVKGEDGEYTLYRQNEDGSLGDKVGEAANWADINDLANDDQDAYDAVKGQDTDGVNEQAKARIESRTKYNEEFDRLEELVKSGVDQNGNQVPEGWEGTVKRGAMPEVERRAIGGDRVFGEEGLPYVEYEKAYADDNGNPVVAKAMFMRDGKFYANNKEYDSWDTAEADIPNWIAAEEDKRGRSLEPIAATPSAEIQKSPLDIVVGDEVKIPGAGWRKVKRVSRDEKRLEGRNKTLPLIKIEHEDEDGKTNVWKWTPFSEDGQGNKIEKLDVRPGMQQIAGLPGKIGGQDDYLGPVKTKQLKDEFLKELEKNKKPSELPKAQNTSEPASPSLYEDFDVPNGAFALRGVDYEPEGRVDEKSSDFTDDPERLATKFTVQDLISAFSEAIIGNSSDASVAEILNVNVGDDDELDAPSEVDVNVDMPQVELGRPTGAGRLEFNAGEEFVLAESLFNALWHAGVDPNRVLANIYDSVNGDNKNLSKLIEAQGGSTSPEEAQLVDDITAEIRQIKDATPDDEPSIANQKDEPSEELTGSLIENIAIDFENPDYYIPDPSAYVSSQDTPDENGYTDNPEILATDYETSDLIMQMLEGITDGSGAALLNFGDITTEVPIEAIRDALQLQDVNTNDILVDLKRESNDMSEETPETPELQAHSQMVKDLIEQTGNTVDDDTADKIRDAINEQGLVDWSEASDEEIIEAIAEVAGPRILGQEVQEDITPEAPEAPEVPEAPEPPTTEVPIDSPEYEAPQFVYPGPREAGYTANNTVLDSNGAAVGAGARVQALSDGRAGTVIAVQNIDTKSGRDADYVRVRFDDGTTAVRSARQIFGINAGAPVAQAEGPGQLPPARRNPIPQDPTQRFNEPAPAGTPVIAGDGSIPGVNLVDVPDDIAELTNPDAKQADFAVWGLRAPEIARAGRERASLKNIADLVEKVKEARDIVNSSTSSAEERDKARNDEEALTAQVERIVRDTFGTREGVTFGKNNYTIKDNARVTFQKYVNGEIEVSIGFAILNDQGERIGEGSRTLTGKDVANPDGTTSKVWSVKNNILKIPNARDKKSGFVTAYNRYMEDWYIANGVSSVKVYAAGGGAWQGGFVWAVNGFNWDKNQASQVPRILRSMLMKRGVTDEEKAIINRMQERIAKDNPTGDYTPDTVPTPLEVALIGWYPGATNWIGKKQMIGMSWYGEKRLDPQAVEQRQAINYDQSRNARKRIEDKVNKAGVSRDLVLKMNSNEFADANPELAPYIDQIRDVLRSNRSLAVLSPAAKTALNRFTASQLLKGEDRTVALQDIFKLRTALDAEFKADNPLVGSKDFGVGNQLLDVSFDDVNAGRVPGFTVKRLGMYESGVNETFMLTHNDSGQVFFVKKDSYAAQYQINGAGAEVQADVMLRASGVVAGYEARVSNVDEEIIVMQRAGAGVPLLGEPMTASNAIGNKLSINLPDGTTVKVTASNFMDLLHTPEDAVRVMLVDLIISNMDRHNGNLLLAVDGTDTGKIRLLPIDHALSSFSPDTEGMQFTVRELFDNSFDNLYGMAMPVLTKRLKQEELLDLFKNEARIMMQELNNPANLPTGKELDLIIKNFGSLDAYRQKIQERIDSLLSPRTEGYQAFLNVLKPGYWSTR